MGESPLSPASRDEAGEDSNERMHLSRRVVR